VAAELEALAAALAARPLPQSEPETPPDDPIAAADGDPPPPDPTRSPPGAGITTLPEGELLADAYQRVVVTASRTGQAPIDSPSAVTILTEEDIRMSGATSLADLLRRVVGVDAMSLAAGHTDISIRGFNRELSNKVLVLVDGRSTYQDFVGSTIWAELPLTLDEVERIEIIRGPGSAVYGANAVTGVINILTRTPGEGLNRVRVTAGAPGLINGSALLTGRRDRTAWRASVGGEQHGRWAKPWEGERPESLTPFVPQGDDLATQVIKATGRLDHSFGASGLASSSAGFSQGFTEFYNLGALGDYGLGFTSSFVRADLAYGPGHLRAFWNHLQGEAGPWMEPTDTARSLRSPLRSDTVDVEGEFREEVVTGPITHRLNGGAGWRYKRIADFEFLGLAPGDDPIQQQHLHAFLNDEAGFGDWRVVASLRADKHPLIPLDQTLSPRGAAIWRARETTSLRLSGGTAFRGPTLVESYMDFALPTTVDGVFIQDYGDQALRPERALTAELGVHDESSLVHVADLAVYVNQVSDLIDLDRVRPSVAPFDPAEQGFLAGTSGWVNRPDRYTAWGVEADLQLFPVDGLDLFGNATVTQIVETSASGTRPDDATSFIKANAGFAWRSPWKLDVSASAHYTGAQTWRLREFDATGDLVEREYELPSRLLVNGRFAVRPTADDRLEVSVAAWNGLALADPARRREHPKGQLVGPRMTASLSWDF
jgi:iron complex outermembrane receptor protein